MPAGASYIQESERGSLDFHWLVEQHYAALYRFAMSLAHKENEAMDLVQDTFLVWGRRGHQLQDPMKAKGWLFTTLHRRFLETRRRSTRFPEVELVEADAELPVVDPGLVAKLDGRAIVELLGRVDEQFRGAVALFYLEDYSYNEIAEVLGVPLGTVKSRIARGIAQLKRLVLDTQPLPLNQPKGEL